MRSPNGDVESASSDGEYPGLGMSTSRGPERMGGDAARAAQANFGRTPHRTDPSTSSTPIEVPETRGSTDRGSLYQSAKKLGMEETLVTELPEGGECTASLLPCIGCPNAVITPMHFLRLVALRDALVRAARSTHRKRAAAYDSHVARIEHLLGQVPKPELKHAGETVTPHDIDIIEPLSRKDSTDDCR